MDILQSSHEMHDRIMLKVVAFYPSSGLGIFSTAHFFDYSWHGFTPLYRNITCVRNITVNNCGSAQLTLSCEVIMYQSCNAHMQAIVIKNILKSGSKQVSPFVTFLNYDKITRFLTNYGTNPSYPFVVYL